MRMHIVLVTTRAVDVAPRMEEMRKRLDARHYEPSLFKYHVVDNDALVTVKFSVHGEAADFAMEFRGSVLPAAS
jgi:hypothetical protein